MQPTSLISEAPLWFEGSPGVVSSIARNREEEHPRLVKEELGFKLPPVMGKCVEQLVEEIWAKVRGQW